MFLAFISLSSCSFILPHEEKAFVSWMRSNNLFYIGDEYHFRLGIFLTNSRYIKQHNSANKKYKLGLNQFAAYTQSEYQSILNNHYKPSTRNHISVKTEKKSNVESFDWREKDVLNPVKYERQACPSNWAYVTVDAAEAAYTISTGKKYEFSFQELLDCVIGCSGCKSGSVGAALDYIIQYQEGKFCLQSDYHYSYSFQECKFSEFEHYGSISSYVKVIKKDSDDLAENY